MIYLVDTNVLIIGNGIAGLSCAEEIRRNNKDLKITMVGNEKYPTYYRVKLTKTLSEETSIENMLVKKEDWYRENDIDLILGEIVEKIDEKNARILLDSGRELSYEKLLVATGSRPFVPPVPGKFRKGVFALRKYDDLGAIKSYIEDIDEMAVIGGGLLGLEAAWALRDLGKKVHIIEMAENILPRQLNVEMSERLEKDLEELGFVLHLGVGTKEIYGDDRVEGIELTNGEHLALKSVLFSVGVRSNIDLARDTSIAYDKGIIVDNMLKTSIDNIYAAGDVIELGGRTMGLWTSSMEQGRIVAKNILGESIEYNFKDPFTSLKLGDSIDIFSIGDTNSKEVYRREEDGSSERVFLDGDRIVGGILYGSSKKMMGLKRAVESRLLLKDYIGK